MKKKVMFSYYLLTVIFILLTFYEIVVYMKIDSNVLGLFYLFFNSFVLFLLFLTSFNFNYANKNIRVSKNILVIIVGLFSSFILPFILPGVLSYVDESKVFIHEVFVVMRVIKPILYLLIGVLSFIEVRVLK